MFICISISSFIHDVSSFHRIFYPNEIISILSLGRDADTKIDAYRSEYEVPHAEGRALFYSGRSVFHDLKLHGIPEIVDNIIDFVDDVHALKNVLTVSEELGRSEPEASIPRGGPLLSSRLVGHDAGWQRQPRMMRPHPDFEAEQPPRGRVDHQRHLVPFSRTPSRLQERREADSRWVGVITEDGLKPPRRTLTIA